MAGHLGADGAAVDWLKVYLGFGGMVLGQFMAILDIQIVASSLSQIQAGIGASADEMSWVQTIYLLTEVVTMPLTAYMTKMWGTRRFYVIATVGFIIASVVTGLSTSIEMMIATRAVQGLFAGAMIPPVMATAMTVFPPEKRMTANVVFAMVLSLAPTLGPTLGGYLTEGLNWRWLFFVNAPVGLLVVFLVGRYAAFDKADPSLGKGVDWWGLGLMTVALLSMQFVFEEGADNEWFADDTILWLTVTAAVAGVAFVWRELTCARPIVSFRPFRDRNFTVGILMSTVAGVSLYGAAFVIPLFLGQVLRYSSVQVGHVMLTSGLTMLLLSPFVGRLAQYLDLRLYILAGFAITAWGVAFGAHISADWGFHEFTVMQVVRTVGVLVAMIGTQQLVVSTLPVELMKDASGLVNLMRNVGGAIGLAMLSTITSRQSAIHYSELTARVNDTTQGAADMLAGLTQLMTERGVSDPAGAARKAISLLIHRDALVLAYADAFWLLALSCGLAGLLVLLAAPARAPAARPAGGH